MSASLVGSEMCIRDSRGAAEGPPRGRQVAAKGEGGSAKVLPGTATGPWVCLLYTSDAADDM
eukprot:6577752-Alexandrium_andersonii.AAC.1